MKKAAWVKSGDLLNSRLRGEIARPRLSLSKPTPHFFSPSSSTNQPTDQLRGGGSGGVCTTTRWNGVFPLPPPPPQGRHRRPPPRPPPLLGPLGRRTGSAADGFWQQIPLAKRSDVSLEGNKGIKVDGRTDGLELLARRSEEASL